MKQHVVVSYGGGTNSTAMLVGLHERGQLPDAITFSDTGGEKPETYAHMAAVNEWLDRIGFPRITVLGPGVMPQQLKDGSLENECLRLGTLPAKAYGGASCSDKWKMEPARRFDRQYAALAGIELWQITRLIGFDADEHSRVERAQRNSNKPVQESYPLYEWGWGRQECVDAIARAGLPQPGKSACFFCPSSKKHEILWLAEHHPDLMARALELERRALAGEGPAPATTSRGLGRGFAWADVIASDKMQTDLFVHAPEMDCGCYDGDA